jgi:hypothetical protein
MNSSTWPGAFAVVLAGIVPGHGLGNSARQRSGGWRNRWLKAVWCVRDPTGVLTPIVGTVFPPMIRLEKEMCVIESSLKEIHSQEEKHSRHPQPGFDLKKCQSQKAERILHYE